MLYYQLLNYFFFAFHTLLILFNTFGWVFKKTRKLNLLTLLITAFSWFGVGAFYGWGYCFCTDWHWQIRQHLGYHDNMTSYTQLLAYKLTGIIFPAHAVDLVTAIVFFVSLFLSITVNILDHRKNKKNTGKNGP